MSSVKHWFVNDDNGGDAVNQEIHNHSLSDKGEEQLNKEKSPSENAEKEKRKKNSFILGADMIDYFRNIKPESDKKVLSGLKGFDKVTGGFGAGLHILGGVSSVGKTSLLVQFADEFAKQGKKVLFFNFEMFNRDLVAKSVSRIMFLQNGLKTTGTGSGGQLIAKEYSDLYDSVVRSKFTEVENNALENALATYEREYGKNIIFYDRSSEYEGKPIRVEEMKLIADRFAEQNAKDFVIVCDYLQVLADRYDSVAERKTIDRCVAGVKDIAYEHEIPLFLVSAINRVGYKEQLDMSSFKASSAIEYSADSLLGLQFMGMDFTSSDIDEAARRKRMYSIEQKSLSAKRNPEKNVVLQLKVLKYRNKYQFDIPLKAKLGFGFFESASDTEKSKKTIPKSAAKIADKVTSTNNTILDDDPFSF